MARESDRSGGRAPISQLRQRLATLRPAPRSCSPAAATRASPGGHAARPARARHRARRRRRVLGRRVQRRRPSPPRRTSAASSGSRRPGSRCAATRCSPAGGCRRAWNLLTRDDHLFSNEGLRDVFHRGDTAAIVRGPGDPACGWWPPTSTPAKRSCSPAARSSPRLLASAALPGRLPADPPRRPHPGRRRASSTPSRCGTRSPGRSTGSSC